MAKKKAYSVDVESKSIIVNAAIIGNLSDDEIKGINNYKKLGFTVVYEDKRAAKAKERAKASTKEAIEKEIAAENKTIVNKYNEIASGKGKGYGFFAAKSWFTAYKTYRDQIQGNELAKEIEKELAELVKALDYPTAVSLYIDTFIKRDIETRENSESILAAYEAEKAKTDKNGKKKGVSAAKSWYEKKYKVKVFTE